MKNLKAFIPGISRVFSNATPIIILFIFSKILLPEDLGVLNYFIALITLVGIFTDFGLSEGIQRYLPISKSPKLIFSTISIELFLCLLGGLLLLVLDFFLNGQVTRGYPLIIFLITIFSSSNVIILTFNGLQDNFRTSLYYLLSSISFLIITFAFYFLSIADAVTSFLLGRLISWAIFTVVPIIDLRIRNLLEFRFELPDGYIKFIFNNMLVDISYSLFNQWDAVIIINLLGEFANGIYKSVAFLASLPYVLSVVLQTKLLPEYSKLWNNGDFAELETSVNRYTKLLSLLGSILVILSIPLAHLGLSVVYTTEIADLGYQYFAIILTAVFLYVASAPSITALIAIGKESVVRNISILQSLSFVLLSTLFLQEIGLDLLPILLLVINLCFFLLNYLGFRRATS